MTATLLHLPSLISLLAMHAPDGLFSPAVNAVFAAVVVVALGVVIVQLNRRRDHRLAPRMGVLAAFIFAAQMVNFPVAAGTSGHLLGGTLAAILLGPAAGTLVMTVVILFQALLGDGGITVLGPNIFNMGLIGTCLAYFVYRAALGRRPANPARIVAASFFAAWVAVVLAAVCLSVQLAVSGTAALQRALPAMVFTHMAIGIGEALITAGVVAFVLKTRPELLYNEAVPDTSSQRRARPVLVAGLSLSLAIAAFLSLLPLLWAAPDSLESIGRAEGFLLEECEKASDGTLAMLPAYPLGVRLKMIGGQPAAVHQYAQQAGAVAVGDIVTAIGGTPVCDLAAAANALRFDEDAKGFGYKPGEEINVTVRRAGQTQKLITHAAAAPSAGTRAPLMALLPDYRVPGISGVASTSLAGLIGTLVIFAVSFAVGRAFTRTGTLEAALARAEKPGRSDGG